MGKLALLVTGAALALSSCTTKTDPLSFLKNVHTAASGAVMTVNDLIRFGRQMDTTVRNTVNDVHHRVTQVQSGVYLLIKGKDMIEGAVK